MMNQLFIILVFFIKCCLQKVKVIAKYSAVQLAMTILLNGAINKSKIHWLIILVCVQVVSFSGHGAHGENLNSHDLTKC